MDTTAGGKQESSPPSDGAPSASVPEVRRAPLSELAVAGGGGAAEESGGGGDDEQVERFYALLANIRALRDMYGDGGDGGGSSRKRARGAEPPWRPAFRMEDFQEVDDEVCAKKERRDGVGRQPPVDNATDDEKEEGEVVDEKDRVSASQRASVLT